MYENKETISILCAVMLIIPTVIGNCAVSNSFFVTANAAFENNFDKQGNKEVPYDGSYWIQPEKWKVNPIDPSQYTGKAKVRFEKSSLMDRLNRIQLKQ